jgi:AcrR family transcriptional regulator
MEMRKPSRVRLTPDDWAQAALEAIARGGIDAVAVEAVAAEVGATKGSFYWHFENREALLQAALDLWEKRCTDAVIEHLEREPDPAERLRAVVTGGFTRGPSNRVEVALLANPGHPSALRAVRRVSRRRIDYLAEQLQALGWTERDARDRAVLLAYVYAGNLQMRHIAPRIDETDARRQADLILETFVQRRPAAARR